MDITMLFKACVKTVRTRNKAFGVSGGDGDKNKILGPRVQRSGFTLKAKEIVNNITRLRDFLMEHRRAYLNFAGHLSDVPQMSDSERDKIDAGAQRIMNTCSHLVQDIKKESIKLEGSTQLVEYRQNVIEMCEHYLKSVCKIYSEQKAIRVKRTVDLKKMSRLEMDGSPKKLAAARKHSSEPIVNGGEESSSSKMPRLELSEESNFAVDEAEQLSAEELQMFEQENEQLFNELNSLSEEVRQIESKVVQVAELQEIFTEKVLQQEMDIDRISTAVVGVTENVKDGNEQIRQAIQRNAGLRVFILFFLLVMSFSLLFLDWYND
ncbi:hypothetical protein B566_EDAN014150 [Ephemera danica]|nr:hypothetical protein B566_EDAN014150 [Ephemera danica]